MEEKQAQAVSHAIFTVPNLLSFLRLALVPVFIVLLLQGNDLWALAVLIFASISDFADGWIARRFNLITRLGQLLDPAADRLYIFAALIGLAFRDFVPWWLVAIIIGRDVSLFICGIWLANIGYGPLPVHHMGKAATFALFYAIPIIMLGKALPELAVVAEPIGWAFVLWGALLYWWAGIIYWRETARLAKKA
ncbi:MAG: CDP-alcohol phosphatidyltransferase family protein [Microbacteriaceae bacterium]